VIDWRMRLSAGLREGMNVPGEGKRTSFWVKATKGVNEGIDCTACKPTLREETDEKETVESVTKRDESSSGLYQGEFWRVLSLRSLRLLMETVDE